MRVGKLTPAELQENVLKYLVSKRPEVKLRSALGEDSMVLDMGNYYSVMSTDPITGAVEKAGWLAVHVSANDVAANGAEPVCCLLTILVPPDTSMDYIAKVMQDAAQAAAELNIEISGGHTELTAAVNKPVLSTTVVGKADKNGLLSSDGAKAGDDLVVTKTIGLEGTAILATDASKYLREFLTDEELVKAKNMIKSISVVKEGMLAAAFGITAMHDITEGGLLGALYEMSEGSGLGFIVDDEAVPVDKVTAKVCAKLGLDVLRFLSSGSMLIAAPQGEKLVDHLRFHGVEASLIGKFTEAQGKLLKSKEGLKEVEPPLGDELWRGLALLD